jgi:hypothetical protein
MPSIVSSAVSIQTSPQSVPSVPSWFGEVTIVAHSLRHLGVLETIAEHVRFARCRFGHYELIDFVAVLIGYTLSGEPTLQTFYERLEPFASPFMALFGRNQLPHRSTLSRFLSALDQPAVEALRTLFLQDLLSRPLTPEGSQTAGLWDRCGTQWWVFDTDATRQAARQRALPHTPDLPAAHRRLDKVCAPGYLGRKRGEVVRTRTTVLQAHTQQWLGTFSGAGNGEYRGELLRAVEAITGYLRAQHLPLDRAILRLDGLYGTGAVLADIAGLSWITRGKEYSLLDLESVQARLALPPEQQTTHPETGTCRTLFDCPEVPLTATGPRCRMIVATRPATATASPVGETRDGTVYEIFLTTLPQGAFTPADVVELYSHRGAFETVLAEEDKEQDPDRWCSHSASGQEFWQVICQWMWNLRLYLGHLLHPTPMRTTEFAPAQAEPVAQPACAESGPPQAEPLALPSAAEAAPAHPEPPAQPACAEAAPAQAEPVAQPVCAEATRVIYGPPQWARTKRVGCFAGADFTLQPDGTLRCPAQQPLYAQERRPEGDGSVRVLYAARISHCRCCPLREGCLGNGAATKNPRRVSAVLHPIAQPPPSPCSAPAPPKPSTHPIWWRDWSRGPSRRQWVSLLRTQTVMVTCTAAASLAGPVAIGPLTRAQRAHWRLSWTERLARNACSPLSASVEIHLFGIPPAFAASVGLPSR